MAQPSGQLLKICRSCRQDLRAARGWMLTRSFTTTPSKRKVIPSFEPTSDPAFDDFLRKWRQTVFMPAAVEAQHRNLMYKKSQHHKLTNEPGVTVTLDDGEEVKLEPRNELNKPNQSKGLTKLGQFVKDNENDSDWNNVVQFLKGFVMAKRKYTQTFPAMLTRRACEVDKDHIIINCAGSTKETGISLRQKDVARELMLGLHGRLARSNFEGPGIDAISRRAEYVARMLEDQMHEGGKLNDGECDARRDPVVLAVLLEVAAARSLHSFAGKDNDGRVATYVYRLLHLDGTNSTLDLDSETTGAQNLALVGLIPIQIAMRMALKVDGIAKSNLGKSLQKKESDLAKSIRSTVQKLQAAVGDKPTRSLSMYGQLNQAILE